MALYNNLTKDSPITAVEFSPVSAGNFAFIHVKDCSRTEEVKAWLTSVGQEVVTEAMLSGQPVLVTQGDKSQDQFKDALVQHGDKLELYQREIPFSEKAWKTGATLALIGQGMQLTSSFLRPNRKIDWSLLMLAVPNLTATGIILTYGAQRTEDVNRLRFLKEHLNDELDDYLPEGETLPAVNEKRAELRKEPAPPETIMEKANGFLKRNSVVFGEIGLRYLGAFSLAFTANKWGKAADKLKEGAFKEAYQVGRTPSPLTHYAGLLSLAGKTVALGSKAEDPFDPKPHTWLDTIREKVTFRTGGWIETAAFSMVALDAFKNKKISFTKGGPQYRDYISGIGGSLFTIRYIIRNWAPFGIKDTNMDELYAHVTDSLAKMPPDKLPQLMAETAAELTDHFKDRHLQFGQVFTALTTDLYRYHHIAVDKLGLDQGNAGKPKAQDNQPAPSLPDSPQEGVQVQQMFAAKHVVPAATVRLPAGSHQEALAEAAKAGEPQLQMGA